MLINLTNHSFSNWPESQKDAAIIKFENVTDYPFPIVNPYATNSDIELQAKYIVTEILQEYGNDISIHLMGEFCLCYQLIILFKKANIPCYASTTEREVIVKENGEKISKFKFIQFRKYF